MNILLIYPEFSDTFWSLKYALRFTGHKCVSPPLGLLTVAAMLPPEWPKRLVDMNVRKFTEEDLAWADYAFISGMVVQRESARQAIAQCKKAGVRVVAGGPLFTSEYDHFEEVDHFVLNEAEVTLPLFLADLEQDRAQRVYTASEFADITATPIPLWELADLKQYLYLSVQFSRGCPFDCDFCDVTKQFGHRPRLKSVDQIIAELNSLYYGQKWRRNIFFADDNLIGDKKFLKAELLPALIEWQKGKRKITFLTQVSINLVDDEQLLQQMVAAGFELIFVGIETPQEEGLNECNKVQNKGRYLIRDVHHLQRNGLEVAGGFIVGFDSDTPSIFQQQIDFIQESGIVMAMVGLLQAVPGTALYERLEREGRLVDQMSGDNVNCSVNFIPRMGAEALYAGYKDTVNYLYSPENYYQRVKTFMRVYKAPMVKPAWKFGDIVPLLRAMYFLGCVGKKRLQYWSLLLWTLSHRPRLFSLAVTFAILGYHFRRVGELHVSQSVS